MNIVVSSNSKYVRYLYVMLTSLFENNKNERIVVYVLQADFSEKEKEALSELVLKYSQIIHFIFIDTMKFRDFPVSKKFSVEAYFRLMISEVLPKDLDRILYLDVDIIVRDSIKAFYDTDIKNHIAAVCPDGDHPKLEKNKIELFGRKDDFRYFNSGVMLFNLSKLRKEYSFDVFFEAAKRLGFNLQFADQEVLNYLLYDKVLYCDAKKYNHMVRGDMDELTLNDTVVLHFAGSNPWQPGLQSPIYRIWWEYAKKTPFYLELLEEKVFWELDNSKENNAFKMREFVLKEAFELCFYLKGTGKIRKTIENNDYRIGIYGAGFLAEALFELLSQDGIWDHVEWVVDKYKSGKFHGFDIITEPIFCSNSLWIVTPAVNPNQLVCDMQKEAKKNAQIVSLCDWLKMIE